jgi:catechol 2,3-dioxygenase-like lactoylglutathione lyase family enzyme
MAGRIDGAHVVIFSTDAEADRAFFRDVLGWPHVDAGHGWLIFRLPPAEVAVHPSEGSQAHQLYLMCSDLAGTMAQLAAQGVPCVPPEPQPWGQLTHLTLPGGGRVGLYQPHHERAPR